MTEQSTNPHGHHDEAAASRNDDDGGLHAPPELTGWRKAWWWFDFVVLVNLARLRFVVVLVVIGVVITQWDTLIAYYEKWTRPATRQTAATSDVEYFCPMHPTVIRDNPKEKCPICFMPLSKRKKGDTRHGSRCRPASSIACSSRPIASCWPACRPGRSTTSRLTKEITAVGFVEFDERGQRTVSARVAGRIDKLFANETGQMVEAGDPLASLYSPDLFVTVQNLLDAKRSGNAEICSRSRASAWSCWGIDDDQIDEILAAEQGQHASDDSLADQRPRDQEVRPRRAVRRGRHAAVRRGRSVDRLDSGPGVRRRHGLPARRAGRTAATFRRPTAPTVTATTRAFPNEAFHGQAGLRLSARRSGHAHGDGSLRAGQSRATSCGRAARRR